MDFGGKMNKYIYIVGCAVSGEKVLLDLDINADSVRIVNELGIKYSNIDDDGHKDRQNIYVPFSELGAKGFELSFWQEDMNGNDCVLFKKTISIIEDASYFEA